MDSCNTSGNNSEKVNSTDFACLICADRFISEKQYYGHLRIHTGEFLWTCDQCPESVLKFDSQAKLNTHKNLCHNIVRPFKCEECGLVFDRASQLEYHQRSVHLGEKSHICQICEKGFFRKTDLRTHLNIHLGTDVSICEICGRKFNHVSNLIRHSRTHAGIKPYPCTICGKRFTQISSLARHKRIHEREKEMNYINSHITDNNSETSLKDHLSESNEITKNVGTSQKKIIKRQHYCKVCGESFQFTILLRKHEQEHMNSSIAFDCKSCKKKFEKSEDIKEHSCRGGLCTIKVDTKRNKNRPKTKKIIVDQRNVHKEVRNTIKNESISIKDLTQELSGGDQTMETVFYVTAEQAGNIDIEEFEEVSSNLLRDHILEFTNTSDSFNTYNNENVDLEIEVSALDTYSDINDLTMVVPKILEIENFSENEVDVNNYISKKQISKENVKCRYTKLEFQENITSQYFLNIESQDSNTNLEMDYIDTNEIEPTLHLVHIETGEQFYELAMDNISEKPQINLSENIEGTISESVENLQDIEFFRPDVQSNFEAYAGGNFETFDRTNYENCAKQLLELVQSEKRKGGDSTTSLPENSEKFLTLIENPGFSEINNKEKQEARGSESKENSSSTIGLEFDFEKNDCLSLTENAIQKKKCKSGKEIQIRKEKTNSEELHCCLCRKTLSTKYNYTQHMGLHYKEHQRFHCKECSMSFAWKSTLNKHIMNNHRPNGRQTFTCSLCPKVYCNISLVKEHVKRDHFKEKKHVCPICEKRFFKKFDLKTHLRTHTDDKPYDCSFCEKKFYHLSHVIRHERIHTGEKPYTCDICLKKFCQRGSLKVHMQKHQ